MSWSTELFCNISYNRKSYNSKYEVQSDLDNIENEIKTCKQELRDLVIMTEPEKYYDKEDYNSPYDFVHRRFEENIELLNELYIDRWKLCILLEEWDHCHNKEGLAIDPPENVHWNTAFMHGDFVATVNHPNTNDL